MPWDEQIPGLDDEASSADPLAMFSRKRRRLTDMLDSPEDLEPAGSAGQPSTDPRLHRIMDDQQTGNRSGGPAGGYQDPGASRLKDLMAQRSQLDAPQPGPRLVDKLKQNLPGLLTTLAASKFGGMGGTVGAEHGYEEGIQRRHQVQDLATQRREAEKVRLSQEIEQESRAGEQRQFTHGEDTERNRITEEGLNKRAELAQQAETGRNTRLAETIGSRTALEDQKQGGRESLEDQKQQGRMELQRAKADAQMTVQRFKAAHPNQNLPPVLSKAFEKYQTSQSRMDVMQESYDAAIRDPGNQQAQLNLLASHLGMTMGLQPGARMNQAIINEAMRSGYLDERIEAHFGPDGYLTGVVLTPRQMAQMMPLAQQRLMEDARAVKETEAYLGRTGAVPITPRVPGQGNQAPGAATGGAGGAGATAATVPKPPRAPDPGMKWQYNAKTGQFREIPIVAK